MSGRAATQAAMGVDGLGRRLGQTAESGRPLAPTGRLARQNGRHTRLSSRLARQNRRLARPSSQLARPSSRLARANSRHAAGTVDSPQWTNWSRPPPASLRVKRASNERQTPTAAALQEHVLEHGGGRCGNERAKPQLRKRLEVERHCTVGRIAPRSTRPAYCSAIENSDLISVSDNRCGSKPSEGSPVCTTL